MDFYKRMRLVCAAIPYGKAASYGQIALLCGKPKNARQVGYALKRGLAGEDMETALCKAAALAAANAVTWESGEIPMETYFALL